jgi:hypothetical protein
MIYNWVDDEILGDIASDDSAEKESKRQQIQEVRQLVNRKLHGPTMEIRNNNGELQSYDTLNDCVSSLQSEIRSELKTNAR